MSGILIHRRYCNELTITMIEKLFFSAIGASGTSSCCCVLVDLNDACIVRVGHTMCGRCVKIERRVGV